MAIVVRGTTGAGPERAVYLEAVLRSTVTREAVLDHARRIARGLGLPFRWTGRVYPSRKAQDLRAERSP